MALANLGQGEGDLHALDFSLFYWNLQRNIELRLATHQIFQEGKQRQEGKPRHRL